MDALHDVFCFLQRSWDMLLTWLLVGLRCKFQFCYECGADHGVIMANDNSFHGADCPYHPSQQRGVEDEDDEEV